MNNFETIILTDPQNGNLAFKVFYFDNNTFFDHIQRNNYYSLIWIKKGTGTLKADFTQYIFFDDYLLSFSPYQAFMLSPTAAINGLVLQFHPDFFCIHKHQQEVACNGVLFNNIYQPPFVEVDDKGKATFEMLVGQLLDEMQNPALAQNEVIVSYLKIFLITASRLKTQQDAEAFNNMSKIKEPVILQSLKNAIETHYKERHSASDYASILNIAPTSLAKITKTHLNKNLTSLIAERIIIEAKRELYLTDKPVKQIAYELGYNDEYYFSRFFKTNTDISPQTYRNTVGFNKLSTLSN